MVSQITHFSFGFFRILTIKNIIPKIKTKGKPMINIQPNGVISFQIV